MITTKIETVNGVRYWFRPTAPAANPCEGCAAIWDDALCAHLGNDCHGGIWCNTERPDTVPPLQPATVKVWETHRTIDGTTYATVPNTDSCRNCAAYGINGLCHELRRTDGSSNYCLEHTVTWCNTERPDTVPPRVSPDTKKHDEITLAIHNYQQLAQAIQQAGGAVQILETHTVPQLLATLARNNITLQATYE